MAKVAAVYCVYEDSGFLAESVRRVYPVMDKIIFLLDFKPWNGEGSNHHVEHTYRTVLEMFDPDRKIEVISGYWKTEAEQRNYGLKLLRDRHIDWCMIIDDDELYNYHSLARQVEYVKSSQHSAFLTPQQVYWKNRGLCIANIVDALPAFVLAHEHAAFFNYARAITVNGGTWETFKADVLLNHHMSYVRDDDKMLRKIKSFSHADPEILNWFKNTWMRWKPQSENLHPNKDNPQSFSRAIDANFSLYKLEDCEMKKDSELEKLLKKTEVVDAGDLGWLKTDPAVNGVIDFYFKFVTLLSNAGKSSFLDIGTESGHLYYTMCDAVLKSDGKGGARVNSLSEHELTSTNATYEAFSTKIDLPEFKNPHYDMIHIHRRFGSQVDQANLINYALKPGGFICVSGTQAQNSELFQMLKKDSFGKIRPNYEFKNAAGFGIIEWGK